METTQVERRRMVTLPQEEFEAVLEGAAASGAARGYRGFHIQPWSWAAADVDVAAADQSARLVECSQGVAPVGLWWRESTTGTRYAPRG